MLKFYNTLVRKKEDFKPREKNKIQMFVCGPTVYDLAHIGHARTYIFFDALTCYLKKNGYDFYYLQNITDIDDKIIKRAQELKKNPKEIASEFEKKYYVDMKALKVNGVSQYAKATDHIKEIQSQVSRLLKRNLAYKIENDGVYFNINKFKDYGKLSKRTVEQAQDGVSRIDQSKAKKNKGDFCLWKFSKLNPPAGVEPKWESPWGKGRPGWHIEDTAIAEKYFGFQYDIHGGGRDLMFPHHEAEIAQMESISEKKPFVKYWLHTGFLTINNQKMSKSLGNFITIRDFLKKQKPEILRMFIFSSHYRSPIDYSENAIAQAKENIDRLNELFLKIEEKLKDKVADKNSSFIEKYSAILENDFNTPKFFSKVFELVRKTNEKIDRLSQKELKDIYSLLKFIDLIFKIIPGKKDIPDEIIKLVKKREKYRKEKNWQESDKIRNEIQKKGYQVKDTDTGQKITKI